MDTERTIMHKRFCANIIYLSLLLISSLLVACNEKDKLPTVTTGIYTAYPDSKTVQCEGYVVTDGGNLIVDRGICYMQGTGTPTVANYRISAGSGKGSFTAILRNIEKGEYCYRAFATNSAGTAYGDVASFTMSDSGSAQGGGGENSGNGEQQDGEFITVARAIEIANALQESEQTGKNYKVKAKVLKIITSPDKIPGTFTNIHLKIQDETGEIGCYYTNYIGNVPFSSAGQIPVVGADVIVEGPLHKYVGTNNTTSPEFYYAWFVSISEETGESQEEQGNYLIVNNNKTAIANASCLLVYRYAVNPTFQSDLTLYFYDSDGNVVFYIANNSLSSISNIPTGTWTYLDTRTYRTDTYYAWGSTTFGSKYNYKALSSFVISQNGNNYIVDCIINTTTKLHYEGPIQLITRTEDNS